MGSCSDTDIDPGSVPKQNRCLHGLLSTFRRTLQLFKWTILNVIRSFVTPRFKEAQ